MTSVISAYSTDPSASRVRADVTTFSITSAQGDEEIKACAGARGRPREPDTPSEVLSKALLMGQNSRDEAHRHRALGDIKQRRRSHHGSSSPLCRGRRPSFRYRNLGRDILVTGRSSPFEI